MLLIVGPDSKIPPEEVQKFFDGLSQKNNLCVLTGDKTAMGSGEKPPEGRKRRRPVESDLFSLPLFGSAEHPPKR